MKKIIEIFLAPLLFLLRKMGNVMMRDVRYTINCNTNEQIFYLEQEIRSLHRMIEKVYAIENMHASSMLYNNSFYREQCYRSYVSAIHVLKPLLERLRIQNIVDFGCGVGPWLYAAKQLGIPEVCGYDGDYVDRTLLLIEEEEFHSKNLEKQVHAEKKFDIAISMEVAEHLHESVADTFINSICEASDVVLFSAAHVGQGGDGHINCQPISYWQEKYAARGYVQLDIRKYYRKDKEIEIWYRENMSIYVKEGKLEEVQAAIRDLL